MTKEDVLQKANEYCSEKGYNETLTDDFKDKFSDFFQKKHGDDADINDESIVADLKFNLNTAFSATSKGVTTKQNEVDDLKRQVEELNKRIAKTKKKDDSKVEDDKKREIELSQEVKDKLDRLEKFEMDAKNREKFNEVLELAKKGVRKDLHNSLENYATDFAVNLDEPSEGQAKKLIERFQAIFKSTIGDIKPLMPKQTAKNDQEALQSLPKRKV